MEALVSGVGVVRTYGIIVRCVESFEILRFYLLIFVGSDPRIGAFQKRSIRLCQLNVIFCINSSSSRWIFTD